MRKDDRRPRRSINQLCKSLENAYTSPEAISLYDANGAVLETVIPGLKEYPEIGESAAKIKRQAPEDVLDDATDSAERKRGAIGRAIDRMRKPGTKKRIEPER